MGLAFKQEPVQEQVRLHLKQHGWEPTNLKNLAAFCAEYSRTCILAGVFTQECFETLATELTGYGMLKRTTSCGSPSPEFTPRAGVR